MNELPLEAIEWNKIPGVRKVVAVTNGRLKVLQARRKEQFFQDNWRTGLRKVAASRFCAGDNDRQWRADFDFFVRPDSLVKIIEGKYDNRKERTLAGCAV